MRTASPNPSSQCATVPPGISRRSRCLAPSTFLYQPIASEQSSRTTTDDSTGYPLASHETFAGFLAMRATFRPFGRFNFLFVLAISSSSAGILPWLSLLDGRDDVFEDDSDRATRGWRPGRRPAYRA